MVLSHHTVRFSIHCKIGHAVNLHFEDTITVALDLRGNYPLALIRTRELSSAKLEDKDKCAHRA